MAILHSGDHDARAVVEHKKKNAVSGFRLFLTERSMESCSRNTLMISSPPPFPKVIL